MPAEWLSIVVKAHPAILQYRAHKTFDDPAIGFQKAQEFDFEFFSCFEKQDHLK